MNNKPQTNTSKYKASQLKSLRPLRSLRWITALTPANETDEEMEISEFRREKPQINADERRYIHVTGFSDFPAGRGYTVTESGRTIHRKVGYEPRLIDGDEKSFIPGRKELKAMQWEPLWHSRSATKKLMRQRHRTRMTRIYTDNSDPCVSVSSVQSVFYRNCSCITSIINTLKMIFSFKSMNSVSWLTLRRSIHTVLYKVDVSTICVHLRSSAVNNS